MPGNPDGLQLLARHSRLPAEQIRYLPDADAETIWSVDRGILFLMAFWSAPSIRAFTDLTEALHEASASVPQLIVLDIDGAPGVCQLPELVGRIHGYGEAVVVRDGRIVHLASLARGPDGKPREETINEVIAQATQR
ncbi:hypothetical protein Mal4_05870 [Maioricimonas rarisocia]|uniref:Thioredoxin domain-containing protein n=1 Tax=Maioricimonas rarisocia TaxID=2528026 RepID=A0A517Z1F3_9PLAN|nr:hypothetical protein [Maioricimonas rarisocia]QDU36302.1 hypothetical protein Mal4_05870 [Maioricimonas rarisocia]